MSFLKVESDKCTKCGLCAEHCPIDSIGMTPAGPEEIRSECVKCGHCVAICPTAALDNEYTPLAEQKLFDASKYPDAKTAEIFIRSRRSIRHFTEQSVPRDKVSQLLDVARCTQTGANSQGIAFLVIDNHEKISELSHAVIDWAKNEAVNNAYLAPLLERIVKHYEKAGGDPILRNAPCLIMTVMDKQLPPLFRENGRFALHNAELFAPALGLGSCWCGIFEACLNAGFAPAIELLGLPDNMVVSGAIVTGYPKYKFQRIVERNPLDITWR